MKDGFMFSGSSPTGECFAESGNSPPASISQSPTRKSHRHPDFVLQPEGSFYLLIPISDTAVAWADRFLVDVRHVDSGVVIERRYVFGIVEGILEDGMVVDCTE